MFNGRDGNYQLSRSQEQIQVLKHPLTWSNTDVQSICPSKPTLVFFYTSRNIPMGVLNQNGITGKNSNK